MTNDLNSRLVFLEGVVSDLQARVDFLEVTSSDNGRAFDDLQKVQADITALQDLAVKGKDALQMIQADVARLQEQQQQYAATQQDQVARMNDVLQKIQVDAARQRQQQKEHDATQEIARLGVTKLRRFEKTLDKNTAAIRDLRSHTTTSVRELHQEVSRVILESASCWEKLAASVRNCQGDRREPEEEQ